jgi:hypothetical protein
MSENQDIVTRLRNPTETIDDMNTMWEGADEIDRMKDNATVATRMLAIYQDALRRLHQHNLDRGEIGIPNGDGTFTEVNDGAEYADSDLYDLVESTLNWKPGDHRWHTRMNLICCRDCGFVMNMDRPNKPCKGAPKVGPREMLNAVVSSHTVS